MHEPDPATDPAAGEQIVRVAPRRGPVAAVVAVAAVIAIATVAVRGGGEEAGPPPTSAPTPGTSVPTDPEGEPEPTARPARSPIDGFHLVGDPSGEGVIRMLDDIAIRWRPDHVPVPVDDVARLPSGRLVVRTDRRIVVVARRDPPTPVEIGTADRIVAASRLGHVWLVDERGDHDEIRLVDGRGRVELAARTPPGHRLATDADGPVLRTPDGRLARWEPGTEPRPIAGATAVVAEAAGADGTLAWLSDDCDPCAPTVSGPVGATQLAGWLGRRPDPRTLAVDTHAVVVGAVDDGGVGWLMRWPLHSGLPGVLRLGWVPATVTVTDGAAVAVDPTGTRVAIWDGRTTAVLPVRDRTVSSSDRPAAARPAPGGAAPPAS